MEHLLFYQRIDQLSICFQVRRKLGSLQLYEYEYVDQDSHQLDESFCAKNMRRPDCQ